MSGEAVEPDPCNGLSTLSGDDARRDAVLDSVELQRALLEASAAERATGPGV